MVHRAGRGGSCETFGEFGVLHLSFGLKRGEPSRLGLHLLSLHACKYGIEREAEVADYRGSHRHVHIYLLRLDIELYEFDSGVPFPFAER